METTATPKSQFKKITDKLSTVLLILTVICCILVGYRIHKMHTTGEQAYWFDHRPLLVLTGSMEPYMETNALCMTKKITSPDQVELGDVVTYHVNTNDGQTLRITHRIIAIDDGKYYTKGDNNRVSDGYALPFEALESEVVFVWNGASAFVDLMFWFAGKWEESYVGKLICFCAAVAVICAYNLICTFLGWIWHLCFKRTASEGRRAEQTERATCATSFPTTPGSLETSHATSPESDKKEGEPTTPQHS